MSVTQFQPSIDPGASFVPARSVSVELAASRAFANNANHHLWKNGRLWWIAFTLIHDGWRQERVRQSLGTDSLREARRRRDSILALFARSASTEDGCLDPDGCDAPQPDYAGIGCAVTA